MSRHPHLISIIVPTFNEENNVRRAYQAVKQVFAAIADEYDFEMVFTDNCSTDSTAAVLRELAGEDSRVRVALFTRNFGFNKSILTGYRLAKGEAAIQMDCDLQDSPTLFPEFLALWKKGHDVVIGVRKVRHENRVLQWIRKAYYRLLNKMTEDILMLDGGDFRLVDRSILQRLRKIHESKPYVRGLVSAMARNQIGIPYERQKRLKDKSKFPFFRLLELAIDGIVSHSTIPLRIASLTGMVIALGTMILASVYLFGRVFFAWNWPAGFATQVILNLFSICLNAIFLGIIGEYLARIYHQLREHPFVVIREVLNLESTVLNDDY